MDMNNIVINYLKKRDELRNKIRSGQYSDEELEKMILEHKLFLINSNAIYGAHGDKYIGGKKC